MSRRLGLLCKTPTSKELQSFFFLYRKKFRSETSEEGFLEVNLKLKIKTKKTSSKNEEWKGACFRGFFWGNMNEYISSLRASVAMRPKFYATVQEDVIY